MAVIPSCKKMEGHDVIKTGSTNSSTFTYTIGTGLPVTCSAPGFSMFFIIASANGGAESTSITGYNQTTGDNFTLSFIGTTPGTYNVMLGSIETTASTWEVPLGGGNETITITTEDYSGTNSITGTIKGTFDGTMNDENGDPVKVTGSFNITQ